jgi:hypothetical protein
MPAGAGSSGGVVLAAILEYGGLTRRISGQGGIGIDRARQAGLLENGVKPPYSKILSF